MKNLKKAASLLLACVLLLGLLPQQALAAGRLTLTYQPWNDDLMLGLEGLDKEKVVYGVQLQLTLEGQRDASDIALTPAEGLKLDDDQTDAQFSPDHAILVQAGQNETTLTVYLVSAYALNNQSTLALGTLTGKGQALKIKSAHVGLVYSEDFTQASDGQVVLTAVSVGQGTVPGNPPPFLGNPTLSGPSYAIETFQGAHGTFQISPQNAQQGQTVTITLSPEAGYQLESLSVADTAGNKIAVAGNGNQYTFRMPAAKVFISALFSEIDPSSGSGSLEFDDVSAGDWFYDAVQYVCSQGMMNGMGNGTFAPYTTTSRAMIVTILYRLENQPQATGGAFTDVDAGQWYADAVAWASANGIVTGYGGERAGQFGPNDPITRQQMAAILLRYAKYKNYDVSAQGQLSAFTDQGDIDSYALEAMQWANGAGLITGVTESTLVPGGNANRAQAATILMRFCQTIAQ